MEINVNLSGLADAVNRMRELERASGQVARNLQGTRAASGPMGRSGEAMAGLAAARAGGNPTAIFDAEYRAAQANRAVERAQRVLQGSTMSDRLMTAVSTSRFGAGGVMPLIGRTAAVLGGEAAAGPIGMAVAGAGAAIAGFSNLMQDASQSVGEFRRAATISGGTAGDVARAGAMGIAPGQVGGAAAALRERLTNDPMAMMFAQRNLGISPQMPRVQGEVNEAKLLNLTLERLRGLGKEQGALEQLRTARELGLEGYLDELRVSDRVWNARQRDTRAQEIVMTRTSQDFRDLAGETGRASQALEAMKAAVGGMFAPGVGKVTGFGASILNTGAGALGAIGAELGRGLPGLREFNMFANLLGSIDEFMNPGENNPQKEHTEAIKANTRMLREGTSGGGPRAEGAVPTALRGRMLADAAEGDRLSLGIFQS